MIISYDIPDDKRRTKIAKTLEDFGTRVQYSVFECDLKPMQLQRLRQRLQKIVKPRCDDVRFYFLCEACVPKMKRMGNKRVPIRQDAYFI